jgi:hypothetical protein
MVSPGDAAATAALIVDWQPDVPLGFTHRLAAEAVPAAPKQKSSVSPAGKISL